MESVSSNTYVLCVVSENLLRWCVGVVIAARREDDRRAMINSHERERLRMQGIFDSYIMYSTTTILQF